MFSTSDLERLITVKRREIEKEKTALGLAPAHDTNNQEHGGAKDKKRVKIAVNSKHDDSPEDKKEVKRSPDELQDIPPIPAGLERYIRRYIGLPVMLKAGEYSPNNPLIRGERAPGDVLLGLGEYERRRNTLRKLRQQQYREYLDEQAKKKQEAKEQADRERRKQEEKERKWEEEKERERRQIDQDRLDAEDQRRSSVCYVPTHNVNVTQSSYKKNKVDTGVQVGISRPLSVAVQTDDAELYRLSASPTISQLTQAERELSPRTVLEPAARPIQPAHPAHPARPAQPALPARCAGARARCEVERRRSYGDFDERSSTISKKSNRDKLVSDLRHTYMPSIFDADAIQLRNLQAEKEAAERRQFYQQELKNQIQEQQRIREERKSREKMLEQAEMRRLEEQLRMLRVAQEIQVDKQRDITATMKESAREFDKKRTSLQKEIDYEHQKLLRATTQPVKRNTVTSHSDTVNTKLSKLPFYYPRIEKQPFSTNIPDNSIFSPNYDVDSYLRRNLNPPKDSLRSNLESVNSSYVEDKNVVVQKVQALVHESPKEKLEKRYEPSFKRKDFDIKDELPILKHSQINPVEENKEKLSKSMKLVEDKWQVPVVQKNLLKNLPNEEGKNVSILTQLGSIRRQLQLEQLKLDNMISTDDI